MRLALAQFNSTMGDFDGNKDRMLDLIRQARAQKCDLVIFPELALFGYSPNDLLERQDLINDQLKALQSLAKNKPKDIAALVGAVTRVEKGAGKPLFNSAVFLKEKIRFLNKQLLPSYDVFDETRFFRPGKIEKNFISMGKKNVLVLVCEDMWGWEREEYDNPLKGSLEKKVDFVVSINASPFCIGKRERRLNMAKQTAKKLKCPVVYVNMVGAQDEIIFDGGSFVVDSKGQILGQAAHFKEELLIVDLFEKSKKIITDKTDEGEILRQSLVLGIRDFARKNQMRRIHLGLSGGIDSAVALCLAVEAIGAENVTALALPGPHSASESLTLAQQLAKNLGCAFQSLPIQNIYQQQLKDFESVFGPQKFGLLHENLQARIRGSVLMMYSNLQSSLLLATSNKSELATGYSTLYGDMCGGLAPLGDLLKRQVYAVAENYNKDTEVIPRRIIDRAPSAELAPNQKDQDSLPPYEELDSTVHRLVTQMALPKTKEDQWLLKKMAYSEFKRWQAAPILRVSEHAFGRGRRWPISGKAYKN